MNPSGRLVLKLGSVVVVAVAAYLSHAVGTREAARNADAPGPLALRAFGAVQPRLAPNGKDIILSYQGGIWRTTTDGGTLRRLAGGRGFAVAPCWSPDGRRIAFLQGTAWGSGALRLIDAQTGQPLPLPGNADVHGSGALAFTPDGRRLLGLLRTRTQVEALRSLDLASGKLETVRRLPSSRQPWALSADGRWVAFVTTMDVPDEQAGNNGPQADLWKLSLSGGEPERIVRFPARIHDLCWSADGKSLFLANELGGAHNDLWRLDLNDPDRPVKLTAGQADEDQPSVSADGRLLLYRDNREGAPALVLHDLASGAARPLTFTRLDHGVSTGRLRLAVRDKATGRIAVARLSLRHEAGGHPAPPGALWRVFRDFGHFTARDTVEFDLPAGRCTLRAWCGPEYRTVQQEVEVKAGDLTEVTVFLERWCDPNGRGWYSGDNHIHANYGYGDYYQTPATLADACAAEGLNVANLMVANSDGDGVFDREFFRGRTDPRSDASHLLYWNEEFRSTLWGHMTLLHLRHVVEPVFTGFRDTTNPYDIPTMSAIAVQTRRQGGLVNYTHPAYLLDDLFRGAYSAKGLPVYAALGHIDTMDVAGSGERASTELYHRLLNCGLRLPASAGTDCFLNRITGQPGPGNARVYVRVDGPLTYDKWVAGLRAGRSFVSNGPQLELAAGGKGIGDTLQLPAPGEIRIKASASSVFPLDRVEVLFNGKVVASAAPVRDGLTTAIDQVVRLDRSGWLALRALGKGVAEVVSDQVFAHTSPIYVAVAGRPAGEPEDARYFLKWIDRLWAKVEERDCIPGEAERKRVEAEIEEARKVYRKILERPEG